MGVVGAISVFIIFFYVCTGCCGCCCFSRCGLEPKRCCTVDWGKYASEKKNNKKKKKKKKKEVDPYGKPDYAALPVAIFGLFDAISDAIFVDTASRDPNYNQVMSPVVLRSYNVY